MNHTLTHLGLGGGLLLCSLSAGCGTGSDSNAAATGGASNLSSSSVAGTTSSSSASNTAGGADSGSGVAVSAATKLFTFDTGVGDFKLNSTQSGDPKYINLENPGDSAVPTPVPSLGFAATKDYGNDPASGSLMITATYGFWNQSVSAEVAVPAEATTGAAPDLSNKILKAQVWVESGLSPDTTTDAPGGVVFYIKTGNWVWGQAPWANIQQYRQWIPVKFDTTAPDPGTKDGWDPANPVQIGLQISSGGGGSHCANNDLTNETTCPKWDAPLPTVIYIDNITVQPKG